MIILAQLRRTQKYFTHLHSGLLNFHSNFQPRNFDDLEKKKKENLKQNDKIKSI